MDRQARTDISKISDEEILEEAATRLQAQYARENGRAILYGTFRFIFHEGRFQGVEDWPRKKSYASPNALVSAGVNRVKCSSHD